MNKKGDSKSGNSPRRKTAKAAPNKPDTTTVPAAAERSAANKPAMPAPKSPASGAKSAASAVKPKSPASASKSKTAAVKSKTATANPKTSATKAAAAKSRVTKKPATKTGAAAAKAAPARPRQPASKGAPRKSNVIVEQWRSRLPAYISLTRLNRPIGILLLLWPTLWALWLAAGGWPRWDLLIIFTLGVVAMRSAGCVINDFADRKIDGSVKRTRDRPLATGVVSSREAWGLFIGLCLFSLVLVLLTNKLTIMLSVGGVLLAFCYPFMKRHTHLPQVVLGAAFAWSVPMAFAAQANSLSQELWLVYLAVVLWTVVYDTFYAMVDRDDDLRIGVKSTAILFGEQDRFITGFLQALTLYTLVLVGQRFELGTIYYASLVAAAGLFIYQQYLIRYRERNACFKAFLNNHWVGLAIFIGIVLDRAVA